MYNFFDRKTRESNKISELKFEISRLELEIDYHQDKIRIYKERMRNCQFFLEEYTKKPIKEKLE